MAKHFQPHGPHALEHGHHAGLQKTETTGLDRLFDEARQAAWVKAPAKLEEANPYILRICDEYVNKKIGEPPSWLPRGLQNPPADLQCASSASNIYRMVLKCTNRLNADDRSSYRQLDQVSVYQFVAAMLHAHLAEPVSEAEAMPGDVVVGQTDLSKGASNGLRHIGFVGRQLAAATPSAGLSADYVYSNHAGTFTEDTLKKRFLDRYGKIHFLRLLLPPEKAKPNPGD